MPYRWNDRDCFINPYNFVSSSLNRKEEVALPEASDELHTGVLYCTMNLKTPLAVPDIEKVQVDVNGHRSYPCNRDLEGRPLLYGSAIRGAMRSVYEAVTDSCYSTARLDDVITRRTKGNDAYAPAVLKRENGEWYLYEAKDYIMTVVGYRPFENQKVQPYRVKKEALWKYGYGSKLYFKPCMNPATGREDGYEKIFKNGKKILVASAVGQLADKALPGYQEGYLYVGESFGQKHFERIFRILPNKKPVKISAGELAALDEVVNTYRDNVVNRSYQDKLQMSADGGNVDVKRYHYGYKGYEEAKDRGIIPVWHKWENGWEYLSVASKGRMAYRNTMEELLKKKAPCTSRKHLCSACALFGMASKSNTAGNDGKLAGRVRFTDAVAENWSAEAEEQRLERGVTLRELAAPKNSYLQFYLKKVGRDKVRTASNSPAVKGGYGFRGSDTFRENWSYDSQEYEIRGRKFYWHNQSKNYYRPDKPNERTNRNATMDLIMPGTCGPDFRFQVYYDRISTKQLEELVWVLTVGENRADSTLCHKLGHGKAIGLGSVKICVEKAVERIYADGYQVREIPVEQLADPFVTKNSQVYQELKVILDMKTTSGRKVSYPYVTKADGRTLPERVDNNTAAHKWFSESTPEFSRGEIRNVLPQILDGAKNADALAMPSVAFLEKPASVGGDRKPNKKW